MLDPDKAVRQMMEAHADVAAGRPPRYGGPDEIEREQPCWFENTEFKAIPPSEVRAK
jgi:hypothetical protein